MDPPSEPPEEFTGGDFWVVWMNVEEEREGEEAKVLGFSCIVRAYPFLESSAVTL